MSICDISDTDSLNEISLHSLCITTEEPSLASFDFKKNDSFVKSLSTVEILPTLQLIPLNRTQPKNVWDNTGPTSFKPSLFSKCIAAKVKIEQHKLLKLQEVKRKLRLYEPHSWYSVNLLVNFVTFRSSEEKKV